MTNMKAGSIGLLIGTLISVLCVVMWNKKPQVAVTTTQSVADHTVTTQPDGTTTESTIQNNIISANSTFQSVVMTKYKLGLRTQYDFTTRKFTYQGELSKRVVGSLWADLGFNPSMKQITVGFSYEL